jgi:hypothetical protein
MADTYWTGWKTAESMGEISDYVEATLYGVSPDQIVSVSHAMSFQGVAHVVGASRPWFSVMVVIRRLPPEREAEESDAAKA